MWTVFVKFDAVNNPTILLCQSIHKKMLCHNHFQWFLLGIFKMLKSIIYKCIESDQTIRILLILYHSNKYCNEPVSEADFPELSSLNGQSCCSYIISYFLAKFSVKINYQILLPTRGLVQLHWTPSGSALEWATWKLFHNLQLIFSIMLKVSSHYLENC